MILSRVISHRPPAIPEDPVTGSTHCALIPYWSKRLGKGELRARQISKRGGELFCEDRGDRVGIEGNAVTYLDDIFTCSPCREDAASPGSCPLRGQVGENPNVQRSTSSVARQKGN